MFTWFIQGFARAPAIVVVATILIRALTLWAKLIISGVVVQWVGIKMLKGSPN